MQQLQLKVKNNCCGTQTFICILVVTTTPELTTYIKVGHNPFTSYFTRDYFFIKRIFFKKRLMDIYCYVQNYSISNINLRQMCLSKYIPNQVSKLLRCLNLSEAIFVLFSKVVYYIESRGETSNSNLTLTKFQDTLLHKFLTLKNIMPFCKDKKYILRQNCKQYM